MDSLAIAAVLVGALICGLLGGFLAVKMQRRGVDPEDFAYFRSTVREDHLKLDDLESRFTRYVRGYDERPVSPSELEP